MQAEVSVQIVPGGPWFSATLTTEHAASSYGQPVVVVQGEPTARGPAEVEKIMVSSRVDPDLVDAAVNAGFHVVGIPSGRRATRPPAPTQKVYIYNENCIRAGDSVPQRIIDEDPDPDNGGDWTLFEGTEAELVELAREQFLHARPSGGGRQFDRKVARTLAGAFHFDLDAESHAELQRVFLTAWRGLRTKYADNPARQTRAVEEYKRRLREAETGDQARGAVAELLRGRRNYGRRNPAACRILRGVLALAARRLARGPRCLSAGRGRRGRKRIDHPAPGRLRSAGGFYRRSCYD